MSEAEFGSFSTNDENDENNSDSSNLVEKIKDAFKIYKLCEVYLNDVSDDYGELKIARLRMDFARHELQSLLKEADEKGLKLEKDETIKDFYKSYTSNFFLELKESESDKNEQ